VTAFKQQRLKAWQPILTPKTVLPTFFVVGLLFLPLGIGLLVTSQQVQEIVLDYTNCDIDGAALPTNVKSWSFDNGTQTCSLSFDIATTFSGPVYMYYRLTNFYQNHRRYVKSFSATQLQGLVMDTKISLPLCTYNFIFFFYSCLLQTDTSTLSTDCDPLSTLTIDNSTVAIPIYPCGLIANSVFNGTLACPDISY